MLIEWLHPVDTQRLPIHSIIHDDHHENDDDGDEEEENSLDDGGKRIKKNYNETVNETKKFFDFGW